MLHAALKREEQTGSNSPPNGSNSDKKQTFKSKFVRQYAIWVVCSKCGENFNVLEPKWVFQCNSEKIHACKVNRIWEVFYCGKWKYLLLELVDFILVRLPQIILGVLLDKM